MMRRLEQQDDLEPRFQQRELLPVPLAGSSTFDCFLEPSKDK